MSKPRLLDLFCGAGGCSVGYARAGFDVVGVDLNSRVVEHYPFEFVCEDALVYLRWYTRVAEFDAIHASPPCQAYTPLQALNRHIERDDLVAAIREALEATGKPYVIENVLQAPVRQDVVLCGQSFGLRVYRHRAFESNVPLLGMPHQKHRWPVAWGRDRKRRYLAGAHFISITGDVGSYCGDAMGIDWMTGNELSQAIPPAYTQFIGTQLMAALGGLEVAV